jgi:hypothetical protein
VRELINETNSYVQGLDALHKLKKYKPVQSIEDYRKNFINDLISRQEKSELASKLAKEMINDIKRKSLERDDD